MIISYIIIGLVLAIINFLKSKDENKVSWSFIICTFWPVLLILALFVLPFAIHDWRNKKNEKNHP